jgi:muramoyltetrapeptide carboxypeptidase
MHLLPLLETSRLRSHPQWVVGFSDITALHAALNQAGLITIHGPNVTGLSRLPDEALDHLEALLFGGWGRAPALRSTSATGLVAAGVIRPGTASGPLLGGSLTLLAHLCGTRWQPRLSGAVLFVEDVGEKPYRLDRYFTQLRLAGALQGVAGVAIGQITDCVDDGVQGGDVLRELVASLGVPALEGLSAGHERANWALPLGSRVTLVAPASGEAAEARLVFEEERLG